MGYYRKKPLVIEKYRVRTVFHLQQEVSQWQAATFPNPKGELGPTVRHLREEAGELVEICEIIDSYVAAIGTSPSQLHAKCAEEAADVFLLLCGVAAIKGFDLYEAVAAKFAINQQRTWGERNAEGFIEHTSDPRDNAGSGQ